MQFGTTIGVAASTFAATNIDDLFVLVTFFAEASQSPHMTPLHIILGQYLGFSIIVAVSMIGFAVALVLPTEPIGFLGLLPLMLGVWKGIDFVVAKMGDGQDEQDEEGESVGRLEGWKSVGKVAGITLINGGDNVGVYTPLFSQAKKAELAVYVVVYYIMLGLWCLVAYLVMNQKHFLKLVQKCLGWVLPLLYMGLGIFIVVDSECYPWAVEQIDEDVSTRPGKVVLGVVTAVVLSLGIAFMLWFQWRKMVTQMQPDDEGSASGEDTVCSEERPSELTLVPGPVAEESEPAATAQGKDTARVGAMKIGSDEEVHESASNSATQQQ